MSAAIMKELPLVLCITEIHIESNSQVKPFLGWNLKTDLVKLLCWSRGKSLERHTQLTIINLVILIANRCWSGQPLIALNLRLTQTLLIKARRFQPLQLLLKCLGSAGFLCQSGRGCLWRSKRQIVFQKWCYCYWENTWENLRKNHQRDMVFIHQCFILLCFDKKSIRLLRYWAHSLEQSFGRPYCTTKTADFGHPSLQLDESKLEPHSWSSVLLESWILNLMVYTQFKAWYMVKLSKIPAASDHFPLLARQQGSPGLNLSIYWGNRAHHVFPKHSKNAQKKITLFRRQITLFRWQITPFQKSQKTDQCSQSLVILQLFHLIFSEALFPT